MSVLPIPSSRVTDQLVSQRTVGQLQNDQLALFRVQTQLSTGQRLFAPSDDAPAALRAIKLQRLIERKTQLETNVGASASYLAAADSALNSVSSVINDTRSAALSVVDTVSTDTERAAVIEQINRTIEQLQAIGNTQFRDRYLFSGSRSLEEPFRGSENYIQYTGNEQSLRSHVDFNLLFDTGVPGTEVFGGISADIRGTTNFDPQLSPDTLLRDINDGEGVTAGGAIEVVWINTLGNATSTTVSIDGAATVADVARFIETGAPDGSDLEARVTSQGLELSVSSGTVLVREVSEGRTAQELGLLQGTAVATLTGDDISPAVLKTTRIDDLFGRRATALVATPGTNNDILVSATENGTSLNGVTIQFADTGTAGAETATYDTVGGTLTVSIEAGATTANDVIAAINAESSGLFSASLDASDSSSASLEGTALVALASTGTTAGGSGTNFDRTSGIQVTNGGATEVLTFESTETVEDLLNQLNNAELGLQVEINASRTGINIRSRLSGADLTIGENGGTTASQLGIRSYTTESELSDFRRGVGVPNDSGDGLTITVGDDPLIDGDGTSFSVDLEGVFTVGDVIDRINNAVGNTALVTADLAADGNGIRLTDISGLGNDLVVQTEGLNQVGYRLGFLAEGAAEVRSSTGTLTSEDLVSVEVDGVFNTLLRMRTALENNDVVSLGREVQRLDTDLDRVSFARSEVGARLQGLEVLRYNLEDEQVSLKTALSEDIDVDLTEAITEFTNRQYALEASLRAAGNILRMSLLEFI